MREFAEPPTLAHPLDGLSFHTNFQPVFSLTHGRLVGHEALLRAKDAAGEAVAPNLLFNATLAPAIVSELDVLAVQQHLAAYIAAGKRDAIEWLLLNIHPVSLLPSAGAIDRIVQSIENSGLRPSRIVIEVLESPLLEDDSVYPSLQRLRDMGCLIALDDFGAGHSNFERVFDLRPHLVKIDRRALLRAKRDTQAKRILQRMISLIQECGSLVLIEGIETVVGAHIAITCDVDFVQGYFFGRPSTAAILPEAGCEALVQAWDTFDESLSRSDDRWRESMGMHCDDLRFASMELAAGHSMDHACQQFLSASQATMCYLLDDRGRQIREIAFRDAGVQHQLANSDQFEPLRDCGGARWSRRQYFRRAISFPGAVQLTRPYLTLQGGWMCLTASIAFEIEGQMVILCGDLRMKSSETI